LLDYNQISELIAIQIPMINRSYKSFML